MYVKNTFSFRTVLSYKEDKEPEPSSSFRKPFLYFIDGIYNIRKKHHYFFFFTNSFNTDLKIRLLEPVCSISVKRLIIYS